MNSERHCKTRRKKPEIVSVEEEARSRTSGVWGRGRWPSTFLQQYNHQRDGVFISLSNVNWLKVRSAVRRLSERPLLAQLHNNMLSMLSFCALSKMNVFITEIHLAQRQIKRGVKLLQLRKILSTTQPQTTGGKTRQPQPAGGKEAKGVKFQNAHTFSVFTGWQQ